ncbi:MAG TPA: universal stress protein [Rhizomicrobium sp.]|nr:universal stress protein [Rhizomicrobium sp.]
MSIQLILAPLTGGKRDAPTLESAFCVAEPLKAHVRAVFVRPAASDALPFFGDEVAPAMAEEIVNAARVAGDTACNAAQAAFNAATAAAEFGTVEGPMPGPSASFMEMEGNFADCITRAGQLADLIVFGALSDTDHPGLTDAFEGVLLRVGGPVLLGTVQPPLFSRIAIGWNGSSASARAVSAALGYLSTAASVRIITVQSTAQPPADAGALQDYLRVHGIEADIIRSHAEPRAIGEVLLETAVASGANLLVVGGYGHSRLREWFSGGVTRRIISQATLPLLLVH